ncbi:hypothetical protein [Sulfuracidifex tepidarius]|uniref:Uncharacterized protein n=2 Tax=Sulfuracidifex tepidarius TaxID=1294262 RepID=A0A510DX23_9CREN|nr:hypothetical protein [Sulfuracidifex tepidarius]BBG24745.1 hypothetical protein IC006_2079 [Sulfuracidifex tepidarius]BBG27534.1 hypothetical protein IC007_2088 [Sulfuracidifex tepidarius]
MDIPEDIKSNLKESSCLAFRDGIVLCKSNDFPLKSDASSVTEIDRSAQDILIRHVIYDHPESPLTVEYTADRKFIEKIVNNKHVNVVFLDDSMKEKSLVKVQLSKEEIAIMKKEASLA